jgi:hypothetical protein
MNLSPSPSPPVPCNASVSSALVYSRAMNRIRSLVLCLAGLPLLTSAQVSIAMPPISNTTGTAVVENSSTYTSAWAQTFLTPDGTHTRLDRLEFRGARFNGTTDFAAYLVQWESSSSSLTGAPLWTSSIQSSLSLPPYGTWGVASFETGGIDLRPGQTYALVVFDPTPSTSPSSLGIGADSTNPHVGGGLYSLNRYSSSTAFSDLYSAAAYNHGADGWDAAFGATFSAPGLTAVPEPATALVGLGLAFVAGLFALRLHQRRRATVAAASSPA